MNKNISRLVKILIGFVVLFLIAWPKLGFLWEETGPSGPAGGPGNFAVPVTAQILETRRLDNKIKITGTVKAFESVALSSEVSGLISGIHFKEGQLVNKGDLLVNLKDDELKAQLQKFKALKKLNEEREKRQSQLLERKVTSQEEYNEAQAELNTTLAEIQLVEAQLAKTRIYAPFTGLVGLRHVSVGSYISPGTIIASLFNISKVKIDFSIPAKYSQVVKRGAVISFTVESLDEAFKGTVYAIEPQIDPSTRKLQLRALANNYRNRILPGGFANIELVLETIDKAILIPTEALIPEASGHKAFVARGGKASPVAVTVGIRLDQEVQITSGLVSGDTLITSGMLQIRPGVPVNLTNLDSSSAK